MPLDLQGSVALTVHGPRGTTTGTARGDGAVLRLSMTDPVAAWDAVAGAAPGARRALGPLADRLSAQGLAVEVSSPDGVLATVGAGVDSALGRAVVGSRRVRPGRPGALRPLLLAQLRQSAGGRRAAVLVLAVAALVAVGRRRPH